MNLKRPALSLILLLLALPAAAVAKSEYGLQLDESISVQGEIAPTLFAGNPCVEVVEEARGEAPEHGDVGVTEVEADREYWQMALFADMDRTQLEASRPTLILHDVATGDEVRTSAGTVDGNEAEAYMPLSIRFPHTGRWSVALDDGAGHRFEYADAAVTTTMNSPMGTPLDAAELEALGNPGTCTDEGTASAGAAGGSIGLPLALAIGAAGALALALILRRRTLG